jgi:hypothetical protein
MSEKLIISNIQLKTENGFNELGGFLDNDYIYFRVPEKFQLHLSSEWFIAIALLEAMVANRSIEVDSTVPVSQGLCNRLHEIQSIFSCWNSNLSIVEIFCKTTSEEKSFNAVGSFFSAGIDSSHTLIRKMDDITHLIMLRVFDMGDDQETWDKHVVSQTSFANSMGKDLIPVETNARDWTDSKMIAWGFAHGLLLSALGGALGMRRLYVPSTHTYNELFPWGSHPLSDPMWSTESTCVIHEGAGYRRGEKTQDILNHPKIANNLKVCWNNIHKNCGECSKCIRSMAAIHLLGGEVDSLPDLSDLSLLKSLKAENQNGATYLEDVMILAKQEHNEKVYKILKGYYRKYQISQLWPLLDRYFLMGSLRRLYRIIKKPRWLNLRVTLLPDRPDL